MLWDFARRTKRIIPELEEIQPLISDNAFEGRQKWYLRIVRHKYTQHIVSNISMFTKLNTLLGNIKWKQSTEFTLAKKRNYLANCY